MMCKSVLAQTDIDPCEQGLLTLVNRPSTTGSPCAVPNKATVVEGGYQYLNLSGGASGYIAPISEVRFGLPGHNEFSIILPTYFHQSTSPSAGWSAVSVSAKHELAYGENWVSTFEGVLTVPSGSHSYGSQSPGGQINGIGTYAFGPVFSLTGTLGVMSQSVQYLQNGARYASINPDVFASWQLTDKWLTFLEWFGQSRTAPGKGAGMVVDTGVFYLLTPKLSVDLELGQRLSGVWGFQSYASAGFGWLLG